MLMIVDEIQTGFARTGEWFGFQHFGVVPDVVTMAKAMGNGFPVGACWAKRSVAAVFQPGDHGSTYSGTAIATAAVRAVIAEMRTIDAPGARSSAGRHAHRRPSRPCPAWPRCAGSGCCSPSNSPMVATPRPPTSPCWSEGSSPTR